MKILIATIGHHIDQPSGSAKLAFDEAVALSDRGHDVWVLAPGNSSLAMHEVVNGVHLLRYVPQKLSAFNPARGRAHQNAAKAVLQQYLQEVDLVHGHAPLSFKASVEFYGDTVDASYTVHSASRMEMAIVWRSAGGLKRLVAPAALAMINQVELSCLRRSRVITALSAYTIQLIAQLHGNELAERVQLVPGWVDTQRFVPIEDRLQAKQDLGWPSDIPVLFTLRRLVPRMGLERLLHAVAELRNEGHQLHLAIGGSGPLDGSLKQLASSLGLDGVVTFMGRVSDVVLPVAYAACDAFVLPTAELECFGLIALEALASGRPVLATPIGAIPEIIDQFEPQWLSASAESADIAALLRQYLSGRLPARDPWKLHELVHQRYSRNKLLEGFVEIVTATGVGSGENSN